MQYRLCKVNESFPNAIPCIEATDESGALIIIPMDDSNTDYQKYLAWVADGNTPLPADS